MERHVAVLLWAVCFTGTTQAQGIRADVLETLVQPSVDGRLPEAEWRDAIQAGNALTDPVTGETPAGVLYFQKRTDWFATSPTGNQALQPGPTFFLAHHLQPRSGGFAPFGANEARDWCLLRVTRSDGNLVECWIFGGFDQSGADMDEQDDGIWIADSDLLASSLVPEGAGTNLLDDRGFIVRMNGDPATDRHWLPGDPEPGDPGWNWDSFYGMFARAGFAVIGLNGTSGEVYEASVRSAPDAGLEAPLDCLDWRVEWHQSPNRAVLVIAPNWFTHFGLVPGNTRSTLPGFALVVIVLLMLTRGTGARRRKTCVALMAAFCVGVPACSSGPGPQLLVVLTVQDIAGTRNSVALPAGYEQSAYPVAGPAPRVITGGLPPYTTMLTDGVLPNGLSFQPNGTLTGTPTECGVFDFAFRVVDNSGDSVTGTSSIRIEPMLDGTPTLLSANRARDSLTLSGSVGIELLGVLRVSGGDPAAAYRFSTPDPSQVPEGVTVSSSGVVRGMPTVATAPGGARVDIDIEHAGATTTSSMVIEVVP